MSEGGLGDEHPLIFYRGIRPRSSAVEHHIGNVKVSGSIPDEGSSIAAILAPVLIR